MTTPRAAVSDEALYEALLARDTAWEGVAFVGVRTTGIFCRLSCAAKKPKRENCRFFSSVGEALEAGFRPCLRCRPLEPKTTSSVVDRLLWALETEPARRWCSDDVRRLGIDPSTARRQFRARYGVSFIGLARARRLGEALRALREGDSVISAQQVAAWNSPSGFRDAFHRALGAAPAKARAGVALYSAWLETPLGPMLAVADDEALRLLEFADMPGLEAEVERLRRVTGARVVPAEVKPLAALRRQLGAYFSGQRLTFDVPLSPLGTDFEKSVWRALCDIGPGQTRSYSEVARGLGRPKAARAVARAVGANPLTIVVPCHRVVGADGSLTGYAGGLPRKQWLLAHELREG